MNPPYVTSEDTDTIITESHTVCPGTEPLKTIEPTDRVNTHENQIDFNTPTPAPPNTTPPPDSQPQTTTLSTEIRNKTITSVKDSIYVNKMRLGNTPIKKTFLGSTEVKQVYLGDTPIVYTDYKYNNLMFRIQSRGYNPEDDKTGECVFINGKSIITGSSIGSTSVGTYNQLTLDGSSHPEITVISSSVKAVYFYTNNGHTPTVNGGQTKLSLNIGNNSYNELYIGFNVSTVSNSERLTYKCVNHVTTQDSSGYFSGTSDTLNIYESTDDVMSSESRPVMVCSLRMFYSSSGSSGSSGSSPQMKHVTISGVVTGSNVIEKRGSAGTKIRIDMINYGTKEGYIKFYSEPKYGETFSLSYDITATIYDCKNIVSSYPANFTFNDNITIYIN